jgi:hypothetical protein
VTTSGVVTGSWASGVNSAPFAAYRCMGLSRRTAIRPGPTRPRAVVATPRVAASPGQRLKVVGLCCLVCGRSPVDPAHLVPRRLGGCDSPECVVPLCRAHHRSFDTGGIALAPYLGGESERELQHALTHVGSVELLAALRHGWPAPWAEGELTNTKDGGRR